MVYCMGVNNSGRAFPLEILWQIFTVPWGPGAGLVGPFTA